MRGNLTRLLANPCAVRALTSALTVVKNRRLVAYDMGKAGHLSTILPPE